MPDLVRVREVCGVTCDVIAAVVTQAEPQHANKSSSGLEDDGAGSGADIKKRATLRNVWKVK